MLKHNGINIIMKQYDFLMTVLTCALKCNVNYFYVTVKTVNISCFKIYKLSEIRSDQEMLIQGLY